MFRNWFYEKIMKNRQFLEFVKYTFVKIKLNVLSKLIALDQYKKSNDIVYDSSYNSK